jgi:hypothetical protein
MINIRLSLIEVSHSKFMFLYKEHRSKNGIISLVAKRSMVRTANEGQHSRQRASDESIAARLWHILESSVSRTGRREEPAQNRAARSIPQLRRFHHIINSDRVFGTHKGRMTGAEPSPILRDAREERSKLIVRSVAKDRCRFLHCFDAGSAAMLGSKPARCPRSGRTGVQCRSTAGSWSRECLFFGGCQPERRNASCLRANWQATRCPPDSPPV